MVRISIVTRRKIMKKTVLLLSLIILPAALFAGTLLEQSLNSYDPYLADRAGFDSLFMNPAGMAGDTQYFSLAADAGTWGKLENYELLRDNIDSISAMASGDPGAFTAEDAASLMPMMLADIDETTWNSLTAGLSGADVPTDLASAQTYTWTDAPTGDLDIIASNLSNDSDLQADVMNQFDSITYSVEAGLRIGTLINGFGFGLYGNTYFLYSLGAQGIQDLLFETGAVAGYAFDLGPFSLGFSGKFSLLLADDPMYPFNITEGQIKNQQILYGYAWGLDAGLIWEPVDSFRMAVLFSDIIGSVTPVEEMGSGTIGDFFDGNVAGPDGSYAWNLDVGAGLTWEPSWRVVRPRFSLDFYNIVGLVRELSDDSYSGLQDFYQSEATTFLRHMRVGANLRFFNFLDVGTSYYMEYISLGVGVDIKFLEAYIEVKTKHDFSDVGGSALLKVKF